MNGCWVDSFMYGKVLSGKQGCGTDQKWPKVIYSVSQPWCRVDFIQNSC